MPTPTSSAPSPTPTSTSLSLSPTPTSPPVSKLSATVSWVANNILPFYPTAKIHRIAVGNEVIATADKTPIAHLLPAMKSLHAALNPAEIFSIQIETYKASGEEDH
ncbi:Glucan endo-1,3-beta-glucosidase 7 [Camellia lanceoleosa]|uniref:Glucan endo-1,3-beta-glucosidase 7 n=1 Tax=Camellia lanceoleosa TaxID=1840588 RepID=A0ACC0HM82_9ERIC|nr:Glucan endo-1,3-beta-glucosidase 7 [Camellia lanceoleosa]